MSSTADDDRAELAALSSALRGLMELHAITGGRGVPSSSSAEREPQGAQPQPSLPPAATIQAPSATPQREAGGPHPRAADSEQAGLRRELASSHPQQGMRTNVKQGSERIVPQTPGAGGPHPRAADSEQAGLRRELASCGREIDENAAARGHSANRPPAASASPERPQRTLAMLADEIKTCERCGLCRERTQTVFARGTGRSGLVFLGEGPGEEEDRTGLPFVGPAGQLLDRMIEAMKLERDDVYVCNIVKCRPPKNRKPDASEMSACTPWLEEQLQLVQPKVIVALGATAVQGLLGTTSGITRLRGRWKAYRGIIPVMPTFHPAYLLRQPRAKREVWQDLQEVLRHLRPELHPDDPSSD